MNSLKALYLTLGALTALISPALAQTNTYDFSTVDGDYTGASTTIGIATFTSPYDSYDQIPPNADDTYLTGELEFGSGGGLYSNITSNEVLTSAGYVGAGVDSGFSAVTPERRFTARAAEVPTTLRPSWTYRFRRLNPPSALISPPAISSTPTAAITSRWRPTRAHRKTLPPGLTVMIFTTRAPSISLPPPRSLRSPSAPTTTSAMKISSWAICNRLMRFPSPPPGRTPCSASAHFFWRDASAPAKPDVFASAAARATYRPSAGALDSHSLSPGEKRRQA